MIGVVNPDSPAKLERMCDEFNLAMAAAVETLDADLVILDAYWLLKNEKYVVTPLLTIPSGDSAFSRGLQETLKRLNAARHPVCAVLGGHR